MNTLNITRIGGPGEEFLAIDTGKLPSVLKALTSIYKTLPLYRLKYGYATESCGYVENVRMEGGRIVGDARAANVDPASLEIAIMLGGASGKAAYAAGRLSGSDIQRLVLVTSSSGPTALARDIAKSMRASGNAAGSKFAAIVEGYVRLGVANPFAKAIITHPAEYNEYRGTFTTDAEKTRLSRKREQETRISSPQAHMHAELRAISRLSDAERPKAILKFARTNSRDYNAAREAGLI